MLSDSWQQFYDQLGDWRVQGNNEADWQNLQFGVSQASRKYASDWEGDARLRGLMLENARDQQALQNHASPYSKQWHALRARLNSSTAQISQLQQRRTHWEATQNRAAAPQPAQPQQYAPPAPQPAQPQAPAPQQAAAQQGAAAPVPASTYAGGKPTAAQTPTSYWGGAVAGQYTAPRGRGRSRRFY